MLIAVLAFNTFRLRGEPLGKAPAALPVNTAAVQRLSQALQIPTVSTEQAPAPPEALAAFHAFLERSYPRVHAQLRREEIAGGALLYTWQGTNASAPGLLLAAHQDVVPVERAARASGPRRPSAEPLPMASSGDVARSTTRGR